MADPADSVDDLDPGRVLRGELEAASLPPDFSREHPVPRYGYSSLNQTGRLYEPVFDERRLERGEVRPKWPADSPFAVCLTHDIDEIATRSVTKPLRQGLLRARGRLQASQIEGPTVAQSGLTQALLALAGGGLRAARNAFHRDADPIQNFERWLDLESKVGARSTLYVPPEEASEPHVSDPVFRYDDEIHFEGQVREFSEVLREIDNRGFEIGLHPTWYAFDDAKELAAQKRQLESVLGHEVRSVRQHWLHYDVRKTPRAHAAAGFEYDSTLGVTGNVGFRFGTTYPWQLHDLNRGEDLDLFEVPLIAQDTSLFDSKHMGLDEELAVEYVNNLADAVERVGGVLTLNWHPDLTLHERRWNTFVRIVEQLDDRGAWFATMSQLGDYWREHYGDLYK